MLTDLRMRNILKIFSAQRESDRAAKNIEPDALNTAIRSVAILVDSQVAFGSRAADVAGQLGPSAIEMLVSRLHTPSCPTPETFESGVRGLGAWLTAWQFAVFEILFHFRSSAVEVLRRIAWGEYDWTQGNALEILVRLAAECIWRDVMTADFHQNFEHVADEAKRYAIGPLLHRAKFELRVAAIVSELNSVAGWCEVVYELEGRNR